MALTRRQFLARTGAIGAGSFFGPGLASPFLRQALADTIGDRFLVVIFLDGGNDGLNTVTPIANGNNLGTYGFSANLRTAYQDVRDSIQLADTSLLPIANDPGTNTPLGLHPGLIGLHNLYQDGLVAVIQGAGYPDPNLSHDESRRFWETGDPLGVGNGTGWVGRHLETNYGNLELPAVSVARGGVPGEFAQSVTGCLAINQLRNFTFPYHPSTPSSERTARNTAFQSLHNQALATMQPTFELVSQVGTSVLSATQTYPTLHTDYITARPSFSLSYQAPGNNNINGDARNSTSRDLREVAKTIYGVLNCKVNSRFFELRNGGYDTHSNQGAETGLHFDLHNEVGGAIETFWADITDMGVADKVCIVMWSEFSRRIEQNDSGTDHGSQGPMFVIGGKVNGGVVGNHPDIAEYDNDFDGGNTIYLQGPANTPFRATDIRDVYGTILKHWLCVPQSTVESIFPADVGNSNFYWTARNFDLDLFQGLMPCQSDPCP
jgi:uncharacterized protein (DUF1501 family)